MPRRRAQLGHELVGRGDVRDGLAGRALLARDGQGNRAMVVRVGDARTDLTGARREPRCVANLLRSRGLRSKLSAGSRAQRLDVHQLAVLAHAVLVLAVVQSDERERADVQHEHDRNPTA